VPMGKGWGCKLVWMGVGCVTGDGTASIKQGRRSQVGWFVIFTEQGALACYR